MRDRKINKIKIVLKLLVLRYLVILLRVKMYQTFLLLHLPPTPSHLQIGPRVIDFPINHMRCTMHSFFSCQCEVNLLSVAVPFAFYPALPYNSLALLRRRAVREREINVCRWGLNFMALQKNSLSLKT